MRKILLMRNKIVASHFIFLLIFIFAITAVAGGRKPDAVKESGCSFVVLKNADFFPALLKAIDEAREEIFISMFSFRVGIHETSYPDRILAKLFSAVKRGVKVKVILEDTGNLNDDLSVQNRKAKKLLEERGAVVYMDSPKKMTHTKLIVIDQRVVILGSHNLTQSALKYNNEISLLMENDVLAREARDYILSIIEEAK
jgi:phosphatidylserine/phosphatidylglycerophosphate/cardiolipin synthase-like enzyme